MMEAMPGAGVLVAGQTAVKNAPTGVDLLVAGHMAIENATMGDVRASNDLLVAGQMAAPFFVPAFENFWHRSTCMRWGFRPHAL